MSLLPDLLTLRHVTPTREDVEAAGHDFALMLQGALLATASHFVSERLEVDIPAVVEQPFADSGQVAPYFRVLLANGTSLRVRVDVEADHPATDTGP